MRRGLHTIGLMASLLAIAAAAIAEPLPIFDAHLHYNADSRDTYSPVAVVEILDRAQVTRALVSSTPNDGTRALYAAHPERFVPFLRPYRDDADRARWHGDESLPAWLERHLADGGYRGIGEFHLTGAPKDTAILKRVVALAVQRDLILHAHADTAGVEALYALDPDAKVLWAHAGMSEPPAQIERMLVRYPTLTVELSLRDADIAPGGRLDPQWRALFERHSDRFLLGTDTWTPSRWNLVGVNAESARRWLKQLTPAQASAIAYRNAERLFPPPKPGAAAKNSHGQT